MQLGFSGTDSLWRATSSLLLCPRGGKSKPFIHWKFRSRRQVTFTLPRRGPFVRVKSVVRGRHSAVFGPNLVVIQAGLYILILAHNTLAAGVNVMWCITGPLLHCTPRQSLHITYVLRVHARGRHSTAVHHSRVVLAVNCQAGSPFRLGNGDC